MTVTFEAVECGRAPHPTLAGSTQRIRRHAEIDTLARIEITRDRRLGVFDVLIGINLLREGLDIPECALVAVLDADKEGFLRSQTSLVQTIGRAARNIDGRVILYADLMTRSLRDAIEETERRRAKQSAWNEAHGITPTRVRSHIGEALRSVFEADDVTVVPVKDVGVTEMVGKDLKTTIAELEKKIRAAASDLEFEVAARLRDEIKRLETLDLDLVLPPPRLPRGFRRKVQKRPHPRPPRPRRRRLRPRETSQDKRPRPSRALCGAATLSQFSSATGRQSERRHRPTCPNPLDSHPQ